jgi:hypothetical protein
MEELQNKDSFASKFFDHEFFFLYNSLLKNNYRGRDIVAAFDVLTQDDLDSQIIIAKDSLIIFDNLFGFKSKIFTPPALFYNPQIEEILKREGFDWIDVVDCLKFLKLMERKNGNSIILVERKNQD